MTQLLLAEGYDLALVGRSMEEVPDAERCLAIRQDVSTPEGAENAVSECIDRFGVSPGALAHCAGMVFIKPLHRTTPAQYRECLRANLDSAFFMLGAFVRRLMDSGKSGSAVLVSSVAAKIGIANHEAVAVAKAGIEGLVRSATASYASRGIRVNAVAPGMMRTSATERFFSGPHAEEQIAAQYPLGRYGSANDAASLIAWLLSEEASWISGQIIAVDGGLSSVRPVIKKF